MDLEEQYDKIYRYCYMKVHHQQTAEDITQETFLRFLEDQTYTERGKRMAWLYTIARNLCMDFFRKKENLPLDKEEIIYGGEENLIENLALYQAVSTLTVQDQEMIFLRYVNELPVGDIAGIYGQSRFAVYRRLKHCLKQLKDSIGEEESF